MAAIAGALQFQELFIQTARRAFRYGGRSAGLHPRERTSNRELQDLILLLTGDRPYLDNEGLDTFFDRVTNRTYLSHDLSVGTGERGRIGTMRLRYASAIWLRAELWTQRHRTLTIMTPPGESMGSNC
jgi:hypothetical protein